MSKNSPVVDGYLPQRENTHIKKNNFVTTEEDTKAFASRPKIRRTPPQEDQWSRHDYIFSLNPDNKIVPKLKGNRTIIHDYRDRVGVGYAKINRANRTELYIWIQNLLYLITYNNYWRWHSKCANLSLRLDRMISFGSSSWEISIVLSSISILKILRLARCCIWLKILVHRYSSALTTKIKKEKVRNALSVNCVKRCWRVSILIWPVLQQMYAWLLLR